MNKGDFFGQFNLSDFKKWMRTQPEECDEEIDWVGLKVESKVTLKKLVSRMEVQDGDLLEVAREFRKDGGTVSDSDGSSLLVEVESGNFVIHRVYIKKSS